MIRERRAKNYGRLQVVCFAGLLILLFTIELIRTEADFLPMLKWWFALAALGVSFYPLSAVLFGKFGDKGYMLGKAIGLLATGFFVWLMCTLHILKFNELTCWICLEVLTAVNYVVIGIFGLPKTDTRDGAGIKSLGLPLRKILTMELLFVVIFISFMYMKGFNPKAYGTEKMMDYGFMTSMFRTEYFPVNDFWYTGESLNYYYFGQYLCTFLTKLSLNIPAYGYNLAIGSGFAFCLTLTYSIVSEVTKHFMEQRKMKKGERVLPSVAGVIGACAVTLAGNVHYLVFGKFVPMMWEILQIPGEKPTYWFPNSTRYIGYIPDVDDKTIHEFPSYSFILGDLHAHVINITFVLVLVALLFSFVQARRIKRDYGQVIGSDWKQNILDPKIFAMGFLIGSFMMINYWDFPIYLVVTAAVLVAMNLISANFKKEGWILSAVHIAIVLAVAELIALPFNISFKPMQSGIGITQKHTQFYQLLMLWGLPILVSAGYMVSLICTYFRRKNNKLTAFETAVEYDADDVAATTHSGPWGFFGKLEDSNLFMMILAVCAIGLVLLPEFIFVKDIYGDAYERANTMFKLTYQAFILFGIVMGFVLTKFICMKETQTQQNLGVVALLILTMTCGYFVTSSQAWFTDLSDDTRYEGTRADNYIYKEQPKDAAAIEWINENVESGNVVLEACGSSYTIYNRVSVLTGLPTVLGWYTHEWLWHNDYLPVNDRTAEVMTIYTSPDLQEVRAILEKYSVDYIFVGTCEYEAYLGSGMDVERLKSLGEVVYEGMPDTQVVYVIKVAESQ